MKIKPLSIALVVSTLLAGVVVAMAWTGPGASPYNNNVASPINAGTAGQTKSGALVTTGLVSSANFWVTGNTGFGTSSGQYRVEVNGKIMNSAALVSQSNLSQYDLGMGSIGANSIYSYGFICAQNSSGVCVGTGGVVLGAVNTAANVNITSTGNSFFNAPGGRVGIGTNSPQAELHVNSNADYDGIFVGNGTAWTRLMGGTMLGGGFNPITLTGDNAIIFSAGSVGTGNFVIAPHSNTIGGIRITNTGNVGIGTTSPAFPLSVAGVIQSGTGGFRFPDGTTQTTAATGGQWITSGSNIYNANTGNVGIGITTPSGKLDVWNSALSNSTVFAVGGNLNYLRGHTYFSGILYDETNPAFYINPDNTSIFNEIAWGDSGTRTQGRPNAGSLGGRSGFYQTDTPTNYYAGASGWQHLIEARHSNTGNNFALQIAGSFFDQNLYFRKTNDSATQAWSRVIAENPAGNVGIGTLSPSGKLEISGSAGVTAFSNGGINSIRGNTFFNGILYDENNAAFYIDPNNISILNDLRANIFYDQGNTAFYLDPNGNSILNAVVATNFVNNSSDPYFRTDADNKYIVLSGGSGWAPTGATMVLRGVSAASNPHGLEIYTGGAERLRILANGNVGVGTASPDRTLTVNGAIRSITGGIVFPDNSIQTTAATAGQWTTSGANIYNSNWNTGNVGIGTVAPGAKLEVSGTTLLKGASGDNWFPFTNGINYIRGATYAFGSAWLDENNGAFFIDPSSQSNFNDLRADVLYDRNNAGYYADLAATTRTNQIVTDQITVLGNPIIDNSAPTIIFKDTDQKSAMLHTNANFFYLLTGCGASNSTTWCANGSSWPIQINLTNDDIALGGNTTIAEGTLTVNNTITSTVGGFRFPDNSVQTTAATGGQWTTSGANIYNNNANGVSIGTTAMNGARLNVGDAGTNYPASSGWGASLNANILLNGLDSSSIAFHDSGNRVDALRVAAGQFNIGENIGWGVANTRMYGNATVDGALQVNGGTALSGNLSIGGVVTCIQGTCPPNNAIRLTPNLHLNSGAGFSVIANWDNGTTGASQTFRVGNGAGADAFYVLANGNTVQTGSATINGGIADTAGARMDAGGGWFRTYGQTGWFNGTYGVGMYAVEGGFVQTYNNAGIKATSFVYYSDSRMKNNIVMLDSSLEKITQLNGYTFNWKDTGRADVGLIAQEVEKIYPTLVHTGPDGMKSVEYGNLVAPIIEAIKELAGNADALAKRVFNTETRLDALEKQNAAQQAQIAELQKQVAEMGKK